MLTFQLPHSWNCGQFQIRLEPKLDILEPLDFLYHHLLYFMSFSQSDSAWVSELDCWIIIIIIIF